MAYKTCTLAMAEPWMLSSLKKIWKICFGDSDALIDFFFEQRFREYESLVALDGSVVEGALYLLPAEYCEDGETFPAYYLYAFGILPEYRGRGIGHAMVRAVCERCRAEGAVCLLKPAGESLAQYYENTGLKRGFRIRTVSLSADSGAAVTEKPLTAPAYKRLRDAYFGRCGGYVRWDEDAVGFALRGNELSGGFCVRVSAAGGEYAVLGHRDGGTLIVEETTVPPEHLELLRALAKARGCTALRCHLPVWTAPEAPATTEGMIWGAEPREEAYLGLTLA